MFMNMKMNISIKAIVMLLFFAITGISGFSQLTVTAPTFDGRPSSGALQSVSTEDNLIFSYSSGTLSNVLILNGVSVPNINSGWFNTNKVHGASNSNYICGKYSDTYYRNFFVFDLSNLAGYGITLPITSAVLHIRQYQSEPATGTTTYYLSAISSNYSAINQDYEGDDEASVIFYDLGDGTSYGSFLIDRTAPATNFIDITLNSNAIADINAKVGSTFILGGKNDDLNKAVPVPYWAIALAFVAIASLVILRFRKKQLA
jgi:hypothetical protein